MQEIFYIHQRYYFSFFIFVYYKQIDTICHMHGAHCTQHDKGWGYYWKVWRRKSNELSRTQSYSIFFKHTGNCEWCDVERRERKKRIQTCNLLFEFHRTSSSFIHALVQLTQVHNNVYFPVESISIVQNEISNETVFLSLPCTEHWFINWQVIIFSHRMSSTCSHSSIECVRISPQWLKLKDMIIHPFEMRPIGSNQRNRLVHRHRLHK